MAKRISAAAAIVALVCALLALRVAYQELAWSDGLNDPCGYTDHSEAKFRAPKPCAK